jgi:Tfp pilus assembly protein PilX
MAFNSANWSRLTDADFSAFYPSTAPQIWKYTTTDNLATVGTNNYFTSENITTRMGDWIAVQASDGIGVFYVTTFGYNSHILSAPVMQSSSATDLTLWATSVF